MMATPYDYARKKVVYCWLDETVDNVIKRLAEENIGSMVVDDRDGKHVGMLTDAVLFKTLSEGVDVHSMRVKDLSFRNFVTASMDADIEAVMKKFNETEAGRIALVDDEGNIAGILKKKNLERFADFESKQ